MAVIVQNNSLGSAFGGKIVTLNYNYQPNTAPSTATITLISENNKFIEPELLSDFVIPYLNAKTKITEVQYNDDGNAKVLQLELQDRLSFILDKTLILVRGIHSGGIIQKINNFSSNDTINGNWILYESQGIPWSDYYTPVAYGIKNIGSAIIIGSLKTVLEFQYGENEDGSLEEIYGPQKVEIINGKIIRKDEIAYYEEKKAQKQYSIENSWGYSINDLISGIKSLGIKVKGSINFSKNESFRFDESGTVRDVLSGCLSKLGRNFYVDPIDESIVITDNIFLTNINKNIENIYKGNISNLAATSLNVKKSCKGVTGRHLIIKSSPVNVKEKGGFSTDSDRNRPSASIFKKVFFDKSEKEIIDSREKEFIKRVAYLYGAGIDNSLIEHYIFALAQKYDPHNWSDYEDKAVYGGVKKDETTDIDKSKFIRIQKDPKKQTKPIFQKSLEENPPANFNIKKLLGAFPNTRTQFVTRNNREVKTKGVLAAASPDKLQQFVQDVLFIAKGVFVSTPIQSRRRADGWDFIDTRGLNMIGPFKSSEKIKDISELAPIQRLFDRIGGNPNLTIDNLRKAAGQSKGLGNDPYYWIGITTDEGIPVGPKFNKSYNIPKLLENNFYVLSVEERNPMAPQQYLCFTKDSEKIVNDIEQVCLHAWKYTFEENIGKVTIRYIYRPIARREEDGGGGGGNEQEDQDELPSFVSIVHKFPQADLSSKTDLDFYEGNIGDTQNILKNIDLTSIEQDGPLYEASISYFRPPQTSDLNVNNGFSSLSSSFGGDGVTTNISYSTMKYLNIDKSVITQVGSSNISGPLVDDAAAFIQVNK